MDKNIITFTENDVVHIKKSFPLGYEALKVYISNIFVKGEGKAPSLQELDQIVPAIILFHPRVLYDFFDHLNIRVYVWEDSDNFVHFMVMKSAATEGFADSPSYHSRNEAERNGFIKAFELFENEGKTSITDTTPSGGDNKS